MKFIEYIDSLPIEKKEMNGKENEREIRNICRESDGKIPIR